MNKWIKIVEGDISTLPKQNEEVLIYSEEGYISIERRGKELYIYADSTDSGYATHWMPLPTSPDREEQEG